MRSICLTFVAARETESPRLVAMSTSPLDAVGRSPEHLPVGAVRVGRASAHYDHTVQFYSDLVGLPVLESLEGSYGEDGTILRWRIEEISIASPPSAPDGGSSEFSYS
jgi:hypothetical protein